jgi:hypothetical protein
LLGIDPVSQAMPTSDYDPDVLAAHNERMAAAREERARFEALKQGPAPQAMARAAKPRVANLLHMDRKAMT